MRGTKTFSMFQRCRNKFVRVRPFQGKHISAELRKRHSRNRKLSSAANLMACNLNIGSIENRKEIYGKECHAEYRLCLCFQWGDSFCTQLFLQALARRNKQPMKPRIGSSTRPCWAQRRRSTENGSDASVVATRTQPSDSSVETRVKWSSRMCGALIVCFRFSNSGVVYYLLRW